MNEFGLIGLGVMGKSLARNLAAHGFRLALYNRYVKDTEEQVASRFVAEYSLTEAAGFEDMQAFVQSLEKPRKIFLMVNAGRAIDAVLTQLTPLLDAGDIVIDGGNSHYTDTQRREEELAARGLYFIGTGVSGGEEGALKGPAIMPGGHAEAYAKVSRFLEAIAARDAQGIPCCAYIGKGGAGHFVKMVHNGMEYAEMQLIAEVYSVLRYVNGWSLAQIADTFAQWNQTDLQSYLLEITVDILRHSENGILTLDTILDKAGNKGTGSWTTIAACELGVPIPTLAAALFARYVSAMKKERVTASAVYQLPFRPIPVSDTHLQNAYSLARIVNHHQGFHLIAEASRQYNWHIDLPSLARIWTNGCIIRSALMESLVQRLASGEAVLMHPAVAAQVGQLNESLAEVLSVVCRTQEPIPCLESTLTYLKSYTQAVSSANLIQAQRDYFGAHTYQRTDDPTGAAHHTEWLNG